MMTSPSRRQIKGRYHSLYVHVLGPSETKSKRLKGDRGRVSEKGPKVYEVEGEEK